MIRDNKAIMFIWKQVKEKAYTGETIAATCFFFMALLAGYLTPTVMGWITQDGGITGRGFTIVIPVENINFITTWSNIGEYLMLALAVWIVLNIIHQTILVLVWLYRKFSIGCKISRWLVE